MDAGFLAAVSGELLDELYVQWQHSPESVSEGWRAFFAGFELGAGSGLTATSGGTSGDLESLKSSAVQSLIYRYRSVGHLLACTDPLSSCQLSHPLLELSAFGLDDTDLDKVFICGRFDSQRATLREVIETMRAAYCMETGVEFMHLQEPAERQWLIDRMEPSGRRPDFSIGDRLYILEKLHQAALFELFLHRRFIGQKRFSLEGGEILIPLLDRIIRGCPDSGIRDVIMGMSHRGRLNVLAHILRKPYENLFAEFRESISPGFMGDGDVKYHKGHSCNIDLDGHMVHVTIAANPSHLEAVNGVVEGKCRARQDRYGNDGTGQVLPLLIHGDAAFAGQGSVMEVLNMSRLDGYGTGGTIHVVLNNQIGFTTLPKDSRSTRYATDIARMLSCPVFHVQGESPEAALRAADIAMEYRRTFRRDVVIELICYRRHGHNEGDEPAFTQPLMYRQIAARPPVNQIYATSLFETGAVSSKTLDQLERKVADSLEKSVDSSPSERPVGFSDKWSGFSRYYSNDPVDTAVAVERLVTIARRLAVLPTGLVPHAKIAALIQKRFEAVLKGEGVDWGNAETLAYATLLDQGYSIRLSGQDSRRGTFNHRHCVVMDMNSEHGYVPLETVTNNSASFQAWNSPLSEFAVLGFEYGYSIEAPDCLTIWEAQFGDFANGAQVVIDQFIAGGETKWNRASGLVLLLPHGYEGQGAEHSSARIERYLQLCASENIIVTVPSTPAQMFHLLRRQMLQKFRKPLIVFTPKSLLRHPACSSTVEELCSGTFQPFIVPAADLAIVNRALFCSGKIYYELESERARLNMSDVAIVRVEQLYPMDAVMLREVIERFSADCRFYWVQEEPENMGAWQYMERQFRKLQVTPGYVGREADACPASGSHQVHGEQQAEILNMAFRA